MSRLQLELGFAGLLFLVGLVGVLGALELDAGWRGSAPQAGYFPLRVALIVMAAALVIAWQAWRARASHAPLADSAGARRVLGFGLPIVIMVGVAQFTGLYVAMALYLFATLRWQGRRPWHVCVGVAIGFVVIAFVVFERWFQVPLLKGPLEAMLGLA